MLTKTLAFAFAVFAFIAASPAALLACACCAEPGTYFLSTYKPRQFEIDLMKDFRFDKKAKLYMTEAGFDIVQGLDDISKESEVEAFAQTYDEFDLVNGFTGRQWKFEMRSAGGKTGTITLPVPAQMVNYKVDIHDQENRPNGPLLYKEFRFKGNVSAATGIFRTSSVRSTTFFLIFQGRGVGCDEITDFTHWRLEVDGPKSGYEFYGKLASGNKPE